MPVRGIKNPFPSKGDSPTGIFSTRGKQKQDGVSGPHMDALRYAKSNTNDYNGQSAKRGKLGGKGDASLRHQKQKGGK